MADFIKNLGIGVKKLMAYKLKQSGDYRKRRNFSMIKNSLAISDLLEVQTESYKWFTSIPYIGFLISAFLVSTYNLFVAYRSVGLLYSYIE